MFNELIFLILIIFSIWSCDDETQSLETNVITFKKDVTPTSDCGYKVDVKPTIDFGYIIAGCKNDSSWLMKIDEFGNTQWESTYGLLDYWGDRTIIQSSDGGYVLACWTGIFKTNNFGELEWIKKGVDGNPNKYPYFEDVIEHSNGSFYAVGGPVTPSNNFSVGGQAVLVKMNQNGSVLKTKFYGGNCEDDLFRSVIESNDNRLILTGEKGHGNESFPCSFNFKYYKDLYIVKAGNNGNVIWQKTFGNQYLEKGTDAVINQNGGYVVVGEQCEHDYDIHSCDNKAKVIILEIDENGNQTKLDYINGLYFFESGSNISITNSHSNGFVFLSKPKDKGYTWIYNWNEGGEIFDLKLIDAGFGGQSIEKTQDGGYIIGTYGNIIIKSNSSFEY
jgi:hypothetical protein